MKKCEQFKDLILTDYLDGELDKTPAESLERHLLECSDCRAFLKELKDNVAMPFQKAPIEPVPAELWNAVRQNLDHEDQAINPLMGFLDRLRGLTVFPRLVPVFASVALMFLVGSMSFNMVQIQQAKDRDQGEYLVALLSSAGSTTQSDNNNLGTPIEHYFL